jgi:hypothetical protein
MISRACTGNPPDVSSLAAKELLGLWQTYRPYHHVSLEATRAGKLTKGESTASRDQMSKTGGLNRKGLDVASEYVGDASAVAEAAKRVAAERNFGPSMWFLNRSS